MTSSHIKLVENEKFKKYRGESMECLKNTNINCFVKVITQEYEEFPACLKNRECNYIPESEKYE